MPTIQSFIIDPTLIKKYKNLMLKVKGRDDDVWIIPVGYLPYADEVKILGVLSSAAQDIWTGHDGGEPNSNLVIIDQTRFESAKAKRLLRYFFLSYLRFPDLEGAIEDKKEKSDICPKCGTKGEFFRMALMCPLDKTLIGGC